MGRWELTTDENGVKLKILDILTKDDCVTLANALMRAAESLIGIQDKKRYPCASIESRRSEYSIQDIVPLRKQKKKESKGPY